MVRECSVILDWNTGAKWGRVMHFFLSPEGGSLFLNWRLGDWEGDSLISATSPLYLKLPPVLPYLFLDSISQLLVFLKLHAFAAPFILC